jgi:alpha-N-arabinofuranosidase
MSKQSKLFLDFKNSKGTINPLIYGHFAEHIGGVFYDGMWVGEDSPVENIRGFRKALVDSFKKIRPPVLRWPGGCFAETYDWRDGIGPRDQRPERVNWWYSHDKRTESNHVGTHEFMDFCRMVDTQPYFAANMTSTSALHIRNWIEYCNFPEGSTSLARERGENGDPKPFDILYWGIGNENWGGGGQMSPEMNVREYIRYSTVCNSLDKGNMRFIMCGANGHDVDWTRRIMQEWSRRKHHEAPTWGVSVHYYCQTAGAPQSFTQDEWYQQLHQADFMRRIIDDHRAAMDEFDPDRKIGLVVDEWGCWHKDGSGPSKGYNLFEQQSSMRDAMVAAMTLNLFNNRCDVVAMANIAQLCNNLHSLYLAGGEHFVETPNYHVFDMFKTHQGAKHISTALHCDAMQREGFRPMESVSASASEKDGVVTITLANLNMTQAQSVELIALGGECRGPAAITTLHHADVHACNTFEDPRAVVPTESRIVLKGNDVIEVPAAGIVTIVVNPQNA